MKIAIKFVSLCVLDYSTVMIWLILFAFAYFVKIY